MLVRTLTLDDYPAMRAAFDSNKLFQGQPLHFTPEAWEKAVLARMQTPHINYYFGAFDSAGHLLAFTHFQKWWDREENAVSWIGSVASNDYPQEKVPGTDFSESRVQSLVEGLKYFYETTDTFYGNGPATFPPGMYPVMPLIYQRIPPVIEEVTEIVPGGAMSTQPLIVKYLLKQPLPQAQRIMRLHKPPHAAQ